MRKASRRAALATAGLFALGSSLVSNVGAASAAQHIVVIPGVGPGDATQPGPLPPVPPAPPVKGAYGGGFIEFLITGDSGGQSVSRPAASSYATPVYGPPPAPAYSNEAVAALPEPAPANEPDLAVRRESPAPEFRRQEVAYDGDQKPGTIIIDTPRKFLFLVEPGGRAIRYGIGVGRPGFEWSGVKRVTRKAEWPGWTPPPQMLLRRPDLPSHMDGGLGNPLGARALYLGSSLYRIHGTNEPWTIGQNVSSGCIRMMNQDVIDLYNRVPIGAKVVVL
ncbi:MAG TPA: L,D-transpeptidase [Roseiarcus sp.]|nr:L,D-transpeptidase [Roseiarcus sp.]